MPRLSMRCRSSLTCNLIPFAGCLSRSCGAFCISIGASRAALTIGVRAVVIDGSGRVFLVKHTYVAGWHLPGGGVEVGETVAKALARELHEEGNIELTGPAAFFGIYYNRRISRRDHVALYVVRSFPSKRAAAAEQRNRGARFLRARCSSGRHNARDAGADRRSPRTNHCCRVLVRSKRRRYDLVIQAASF